MRNRLNSIIIIVSLTLGLAASFIIFSWASFEFSYDNFNQNKERIYRVIDHQKFKGQDEQYLAQVPEYLVNTFESDIPGVELSTILHYKGSFWVEKTEKNIEITNVWHSDNNLFKIFSLPFISGNPETCLSAPNNTVITKQTADKLFGDENPIGKTIITEDKKEYVVTGVIKNIPANSHLDFNMLVPIDERKPNWNRGNGNHNASIYVLLKEGINVNSLTSSLRQFTDKHFSWDTSNNFSLEFQPLSDIHLNSAHTIWEMNKNKFNKTYVAVLVIIAILLLAISSINFFNLTLVSLSKRKTEIGIRKINGSGKIQIIRQFLLENFILATAAIILVSIILISTYPYFKTNFFNGYELSDVFNLQSILICLGVVLIVVLITGLFPSLSYSSLSPISMLSDKISKRFSRKSFNQTLVVSQLAVTTFFIIATFGISKQMSYIRNSDLGVKTNQVLILPTTTNIKNNYSTIKQELLKNPQILCITASNRVFGEDFYRNSIQFEGQNPESRYVVPYLMTDINFPEFYDMKIVKGRQFSKDFKLDMDGLGFLINESLARELGYDEPVGKKMRFNHTQMGEIIGVVKDFHYQSFHKTIEPMAFYIDNNELNEISVKINPANIEGTLAFIEKMWNEFQPDSPFRYQFLNQQFAQLYENDTKSTKLLMLFTILSIILSSLGLFGLISFVSENRTKEIGVRKVNGAKISEIISMLNQSYLVWGLIGFFIAAPFAWYSLNKWLENFAYKTTLSWWIFALAGLLSLGIALLTISWQSWKAATRNPVEALRYE